MKKTLLPFALLLGSLQVNAQAIVKEAGFEDLTIATDSFINGSKGDTLFSEAGFDFPIFWHQAWSFWEGGFAASNQTDSTRTGTDGLYQSITGGGNNSDQYLIAQQGSYFAVNNDSQYMMDKIFITNTSYAYWSMKDGDQVAKKFGGASGNDPDYFRILIHGKRNGTRLNDSVVVYLADFRAPNSSGDYILDTWLEVNMVPLADADTIMFTMESTDTGAFGINTPVFFALDNVSHSYNYSSLAKVKQPAIGLFPNPASTGLSIEGPEQPWVVSDIRGVEMMQGFGNFVDLQQLPAGMYILQNATGGTARFVKQ